MFVLESAAALRGLPVFGEPREIHIVAPELATSRNVSGVRVHTARELPAIEEIGGLLVATPPEIAVSVARARHHAIGLTVAGSTLRAYPHLDREHFFELNRTKLSSRGRRHAGWAIERATGVPESPLEHLSLAVIEWLGFPAPTLQNWILGGSAGDDDRLDFWWEACRLGGEADGDAKYVGVDAAQMLRTRRERDQRLLERGVNGVAHWAWTDAIQASPLRAILLAAGLRPEHPENTAELRSLTRLLGSDLRRVEASPRLTFTARQQWGAETARLT